MKQKVKQTTNPKLAECLKKIYPKLQEIINKEGYILLHASFSCENETNYLRLTIKHPEKNMSLNDCEFVSKEIGKMLDREDPIPFPYTLEVQSKGLNDDITNSGCSFSIESLGLNISG